MKTLIIYISLFCLTLQLSVKAQQNHYRLDPIIPSTIELKNGCDVLRPVYFNYSQRRLYNINNMPINANHFLEMCRGINNPQIRNQIYHYDQLTHNKRKLLGAMIACGVGGYFTFVGSVMALSSGIPSESTYVVMGVGAVSLFIATPILAISTGIPHQKRKEILFRDLPEAYNFHVLTQTNP